MINSRPTAISVHDLGYETQGETLLEAVDLQVGEGEFVGLTGPNGAGKTTLLRCLAGVLRYRRGSVRLQGRDLRSLSAGEVARSLAFVPQTMPLTHGFQALEVVLMGRYPHLGRFQLESPADRRIALEAMQLTGTAEFAHRTLDTLSGGERQRVFLARALAQRPRILLLDEATANLDVLHQLRTLDLVRQLADEGLAVLAAFHDLNMAARYCDRLVMLDRGRVLVEGHAEDVLTPETMQIAFGVRAGVFQDPVSGAPSLSLIGPGGDGAAGQPLRVRAASNEAGSPVDAGAANESRSQGKGRG